MTFVTVAVILSVVFVVLTLEVRSRVRAAEIGRLSLTERIFTTLEARRQQEQLATIAIVAENPTLKAALDTYFAESSFSDLPADHAASLRETVTVEAEKLATLTGADVVAVLDATGRVFASAGISRDHWSLGELIEAPSNESSTFEGVAALSRGTFRYVGAPLRLVDRDVGALVIGAGLDTEYARELAGLAGEDVVITVSGDVVASTMPDDVTRDLVSTTRGREADGEAAATAPQGTFALNGEEYAVRTLLASGPARVYTLSSIDAATGAATRNALWALGTLALGAFVLAGLGSFWLAHTLTGPIDQLAGEIGMMAASRDLGKPLHPSGISLELDSLTETFNDLVRGLTTAEAQTQAAYLGSIRAFAAMLDARDPYTAGHSERVSALSVLIGRRLNLSETDLEVLRLGALLHDIGKIGVSDAILRKPEALTVEEYEQLKRHPSIGAHVLRQVPFLAPHIPIVELHHERPDGRGYPLGLSGDDIPLAARIVHVADAFDAITSARAYRPGRDTETAIAELERHSGTDFDPQALNALLAVVPFASTAPELTSALAPMHQIA
jgi:putative nucleotidyltransferase with HDIG domain